jgi:hypothetical protein
MSGARTVSEVHVLPEIVQERLWRLEPRLSAIEGKLERIGGNFVGGVNPMVLRNIENRLDRIEVLLKQLVEKP